MRVTNATTKSDLVLLDAKPPLALSYLSGRGDTLVISCAGVGTQRHGQPPPELFATSSQGGENHVLIVSDKSRSWLNGPGIAATIVATIEDIVQTHNINRVVAVGYSMGGTMALLLAHLTKIDAIAAISPQFSAHPARVPEETRWMYFRGQITEWPFEAVETFPQPPTQTLILHGGSDDERVHLNRVPYDPAVKHYVFPKLDHKIAPDLHALGQLTPIIGNAIANRPWKMRRAIEKSGGIRRRKFDLLYQQDRTT